MFLKLSSKENKSLYKKVFFSDENRKTLNFSKNQETPNKSYKFDYVFSEYDNNISMQNQLKSLLSDNAKSEKNLTFVTFGEEKLGKTTFLLGKDNYFEEESFLNFSFNLLSQNIQYDSILVDFYQISLEKFVLDYVFY